MPGESFHKKAMPYCPPSMYSSVPSEDRIISLYLHIPFCQTKCPYCDFNTFQGIEQLITPFVDAAVNEARLWGKTLGCPQVSTVFFGGGTPSYIPTDDLERLLNTVGQSFYVMDTVETTAEANPGDLTAPKLEALLSMGVNRLSIGVQTLDDSLLSMLGRRHTSDEAVQAYRLACQTGFSNVSLDFIYGLPHQTMPQWKETINRAIELRPNHLSLYCLTLEEGTPMERHVREGALPEPDPDLAADMYEFASEVLRGG